MQWFGWLQMPSLNRGIVQINWTVQPKRADIEFLIRVLEIVRDGYDVEESTVPDPAPRPDDDDAAVITEIKRQLDDPDSAGYVVVLDAQARSICALAERAYSDRLGYQQQAEVARKNVKEAAAWQERAEQAECERDDFRAICDEMNALSGEELNLTVDVIARMRVAEARVAALEGALMKARPYVADRAGQAPWQTVTDEIVAEIDAALAPRGLADGAGEKP